MRKFRKVRQYSPLERIDHPNDSASLNPRQRYNKSLACPFWGLEDSY